MQLVPTPKKCTENNEHFSLNTALVCNNGEFSDTLVTTLKNELKIKNLKIGSNNAQIEFIKQKLKDEEYILDVKKDKITIKASSDRGIFYGIKTLKQCVNKSTVIGCHVEDKPDLAIRGVMIDISRSKVPTLKTLKQMVKLFSDLKYNHLELYVEGFSYEYQNFPEVLVNNNYIKLEDYLALEEFAEANYIDLVPNQNGFGHMSEWLALDKYHKLSECEDGFDIWGSHRPSSTLDPTNKESFKLVKKMYDDMLPHFKSKYFNMNFDEPYELGHGKSAKAVSESSKEDVYIDFLIPLCKVVKKYQKTPMIWGDVLVNHPEAIGRLPKDLIFIDWGYNLGYDFASHGEMLKDKKVKFMMAPGTSTWSTITGRYDDMLGSITNSAFAVKKNNGLGLLVADWGDIGHLQYLPFSYPGFIYGAQCAWSEPNEEVIKPKLEKLLGEETASVILRLATYTRLEGPYRDYGSRLFSAILWAEHAQREENDVEYFLNKMQSNLVDEANLNQLEKMFRLCLVELGTIDSIEKAEVQNSINLLLTLVDIQRNLRKVIEQNQTKVFDKDLLILQAFLGKHYELWCLRNIPAGFIPSGNRIKWLMKILMEIDERS